MEREKQQMLERIRKAGFGINARLPIHFLLEIASQESVEALIERTAIKNELDTLIKSSTVDQQIIDARLTYDRLATVFSYITDNIDYFNTVFTTDIPTDAYDVTFILEGGD